MKIATDSYFRRNKKSFLDSVVETHKPLFITRKHGEELVVMSKEDYTSLQKTLYLLGSPNNFNRLKESINQYETGKVTKQKLAI